MTRHERIVPDNELEKALDWLRDSAQAMGDAKAETVRAGHWIKHVKALEMKKHDLPVSQQEREALSSSTYLAALERDAVAAGEYEKMRSLREAAALKIETWRSEQANYRALKI